MALQALKPAPMTAACVEGKRENNNIKPEQREYSLSCALCNDLHVLSAVIGRFVTA